MKARNTGHGLVRPHSSTNSEWPQRPDIVRRTDSTRRARSRHGDQARWSAISSVGARFRLSPATCDVSIRLTGDRRSTDERGLQRFPLPGPDAVVRVRQDALPWTCWDSPEPDRDVVGCCGDIRQAPRAAMCHTGTQSRVCLATGAREGANFRQVLRLQHSLCGGLSTPV
jgi:hypothetical protein